MVSALFHPLPGATPEEQEIGETREFKGNGTAYLRVPGLHGKPLRVRIGREEIPLEIEQKFPTRTDFNEKVRQTWPVIVVERDEDGCPMLMRSLQSNDGIWQPGASIFVTGEWDTKPPIHPKGAQQKAPGA